MTLLVGFLSSLLSAAAAVSAGDGIVQANPDLGSKNHWDRLGDSEGRGKCVDKVPHCWIHKKNGGCNPANNQYHIWRRNCIKTCGYCNDPRYNDGGRYDNSCKDKVQHCWAHKQNGGCNLPASNPANRDTWRKNCVMTCGEMNTKRLLSQTALIICQRCSIISSLIVVNSH